MPEGEYGYTQNPPPPESPEDRAAREYFQATGHWPEDRKVEKRDEEAPEDKFSHYLHLVNGNVVRYANPDDDPNKPLPSEWNGVRVNSIQNA